MRPSSTPDITSYVRAQPEASHIILIDPDDASPDVAAQRCVAAVSAGSRMIFAVSYTHLTLPTNREV